MNLFSSERLGERPQGRRCHCGAQPRLVYKMMDPKFGSTVRMFECHCGELTWTQDREHTAQVSAS